MYIAFDADDTLWHNEPIYNVNQERVAELLAEWAPPDVLGERLNEIERRNLGLFGYGIKGFTLSLIETALEVSDAQAPAPVIRAILEIGKAMLEHPIDLLDGVESTIASLSEEHPLMLITKGDLFEQESKIARSGLAERFATIEIISEKNPRSYRQLLARHSIAPERFVMIGNSVKSDILPVVAIGGNAIHISYQMTWELDRVEHRGAEAEGFFEVASITEVPAVLERIAALGWEEQGGESSAAR